jgi:nucleoside-diphosphate-sugar epimerase
MLIVGCGYIGERVARRLQDRGEPVTGVVRSSETAEYLGGLGIPVIRCDLDEETLPAGSTEGQQVFFFAPPPAQGVADTRMARFLQGLQGSGRPQRIVYISTTGVYGDCHGEWVDESRPVNPQVDRARRRWDAEQALRAWRERSGGELVILRVAGIYGPGKLPLARLRKQVPMVAESDAPWTNRIHADDLVEVCLAAMARGGNGEVYNVSDGRPGNMTDYFNRVADLAGLPRPPVIGLEQARRELSPGLLSYLGESRRLDNAKLLRELQVSLRYPDLDAGLPACLGELE